MLVSEPMELAQKLIAEVRVDTARGKRELSDEQFKQELARLEGYESRGVDFIVAALRGHQQLDKLRALFNRSPFPSLRQCEQDIWITLGLSSRPRLGLQSPDQRARPAGAAQPADRSRVGDAGHRPNAAGGEERKRRPGRRGH